MRVLVELAGSAALDIYDPTRVHDISDEYDDVIVRQMIDELAWWEEPNLYFEEARRDVTDLLKEHWQKVIAKALMAQGKLQRVRGSGRRFCRSWRRAAFRNRKYFRTNSPSRGASGAPQTRHTISPSRVSGPASTLTN